MGPITYRQTTPPQWHNQNVTPPVSLPGDYRTPLRSATPEHRVVLSGLRHPSAEAHSRRHLDTRQCQIVTPNLFTVTQDDVCDGWLNNTAAAVALMARRTSRDRWAADSNIPANYRLHQITKRQHPGPVLPGDIIEYTIEVCNTGDIC